MHRSGVCVALVFIMRALGPNIYRYRQWGNTNIYKPSNSMKHYSSYYLRTYCFLWTMVASFVQKYCVH